MSVPFTSDRRRALGVLLAAAALPALPATAQDQPGEGFDVLVLADLHSAYERMAQVLASIDALFAAAPERARLIAVNGDVFEGGNALAVRTDGALDWLFLEALVRRAPVVLNLGNHEPDLTLDFAATVREAEARGVRVVSSLADARTGRSYAPAQVELRVGDWPVRVTGLAVADVATYPRAVRPHLAIPDPVASAHESLRRSVNPSALELVLSHAGLRADKVILPTLADGTLLIGGHDHLSLWHAQGRTRYLHVGSWNRGFGLVSVRGSGIDRTMAVQRVAVGMDAPGDATLAARIAEAYGSHLTEAERAVVGHPRATLDLGASGREIGRILAAAHGAHVGLIAHTTLGTGFPAPDLTQFAYDAVIRFEGDLMATEVDGSTLASIYALANQDGDLPLEHRTGDFVYANVVELQPGRSYRLVTNDWTARN